MTIWSAVESSYRLAQFCRLSLSHLKKAGLGCDDVRFGLWFLRYSLSRYNLDSARAARSVFCIDMMTRLGGFHLLHLCLAGGTGDVVMLSAVCVIRADIRCEFITIIIRRISNEAMGLFLRSR